MILSGLKGKTVLLVSMAIFSVVFCVTSSHAAGSSESILATPAQPSIEPVPPVTQKKPAGVAPIEASQKLDDILYYTYLHNPSLRAARAEMKAVQERLPQALAGWRPSLDASGNVTKSEIDGSSFGPGADGTTSKSAQLGFSQPLYRGGRTVSSTDSAYNIIDAQRSLLDNREQQTMVDVTTAYMDVFRDLSIEELNQNNRSVINKQLTATQDRFDVGEVTRTDVSQSKARLAAADADLISAQGNLQKSRAVYEQITGLKPAQVGIPALVLNVPATLSEALSLADDKNPEIKASISLNRAAEYDIDTIFGELMPELAFFGLWNKEYDPQPGVVDQTTTKSIGLSANMKLYAGGATRSRVRQAKYTANQRYLEILDARRRIRQEVVSNWETLASAQAEIKSRESQVEAARLARDGVHQEAELGSRTILDALDADQEYLDAQTALVSAQRNEIVAKFSLMASIGLLTPDALGFPGRAEDFDQHLKEIKHKYLGMDAKIDRAGP